MTQQTEYKRKAQMDKLEEDIEEDCNYDFEDLLASLSFKVHFCCL